MKNNVFAINDKYFSEYNEKLAFDLTTKVENYDFENQTIDFTHRTIASAVYSSNIEGNSIDLNSYQNFKTFSKKKPSKEIKEIEDLIIAYQFAQQNPINEKNILAVHRLLSPQFLIKSLRGKYRFDKVGVFDDNGLVYLAIEPENVPSEMRHFIENIHFLLQKELSVTEVFYYAAFIHLRFVHIHPFADGNGRTARILEKWFLTQKLGHILWKLPSEKYYKEHLSDYYKNINLGVNFYELNYDRSLPFLSMLPNSLVL